MRSLPEAYLKRMKTLLGEDFGAFRRAYDEAPKKGLRFHVGKARQETMERLKREWHLQPVPWCADGYIYEENGPFAVRPGKSPYHEAGLYYIQEPSAMLPAERAAIRPADKVLDLCAAPGGKSTQAAEKAALLVANEYVKKRAGILSSNIERLGFSNVIVTHAAPERLAHIFPAYFDCILVDAPCSGEGMMRRDEIAVTEWSEEAAAQCAERQRAILDEAYRMLKPGGRLVYSTCTFEPAENEEQARAFAARFSDIRLISSEQLWPHRAVCEGQYCAVFCREGSGGELGETNETSQTCRDQALPAKRSEKEKSASREDISYLTEQFLADAGRRLRKAHIPVLRAGILPGTEITGSHGGGTRYEPSHAEIHARTAEELKSCSLNLLSEETALRYLHGECLTLSALPADSWELFLPEGADSTFIPVCYDGYALGLGKYVKGIVKNHYPKGLRSAG